ncbi:ATP-dependent nuclease [Nocardia vinacea]|uniref:ATP-dependent nuclease n=1 Tax=Nocardia vinacea TaxID=96468 RepID=UPI0002E60B44|nr:AAA family ATPase [Nocardia vinacea]
MITRIVIKGYRLFKDFELEPNDGANIIVGDNEAGKSTLLEAISLALTGRINGRWAEDELNPYWFNQTQVKEYFESLGTGSPLPPPEILIELYLTNDDDSIQEMLGVHNSLQEKCPGIRIRIAPSVSYREEFTDYVKAESRPNILPTEWYEVEWKDFSDLKLTRRPKCLGVATVDSRTIRSTAGVDHQTREMITDFIEPKERAAVSVAHRSARYGISTDALASANARIAEQSRLLYDRPIGLHLDQSASASWENSIVPQVSDVPFAMAGQGQQAAIKVALAMNRSADKTAFVLIEEPENHLSHTSLTKLISRVETLAGSRQIFLTTHSSFVLNRLGLNKLVLLHRGVRAKFDMLSADTVEYFKRLSGYDTLRLVLAQKLILVEGPSDEMVFQRAFRDAHGGKTPIELGVDVVSMAGLSLARGLQLCTALGRQAAAIRDNDGKNPDHWRKSLAPWLKEGLREVFISDPTDGNTLEPQFLKVNDENELRKLLGISDSEKGTEKWMTDHKTDWALTFAESNLTVKYPQYLTDAIGFVS